MRGERLRRSAIRGIQRDPHARGAAHVDRADADRLLQRLERAQRQPLGVVDVLDRVDQQNEFIAAGARHGIHRAHELGEAARNLLQQLVARTVPERLVDQLESIEAAHHQREGTGIAIGVRRRLVEPIVQKHPIRQAGQCIVGGKVAKLAVRGLQAAGPRLDHLLEAVQLATHEALVLPLSAERCGALQYLDGFGGLPQHEEFVGVLQFLRDFGPIVIRMRGADDHLDVRVHLPQLPDRFQAVPSGGHPHVDEGHRIGLSARQRGTCHGHPFLALISGVNLKRGAFRGLGADAKNIRLQQRQRLPAVLARASQHLAEVPVNRGIVVDQQDAVDGERGH